MTDTQRHARLHVSGITLHLYAMHIRCILIINGSDWCTVDSSILQVVHHRPKPVWFGFCHDGSIGFDVVFVVVVMLIMIILIITIVFRSVLLGMAADGETAVFARDQRSNSSSAF